MWFEGKRWRGAKEKYVSGVRIGDGGNDKKVFWKTTWAGVVCRWMSWFCFMFGGLLLAMDRDGFLFPCSLWLVDFEMLRSHQRLLLVDKRSKCNMSWLGDVRINQGFHSRFVNIVKCMYSILLCLSKRKRCTSLRESLCSILSSSRLFRI